MAVRLTDVILMESGLPANVPLFIRNRIRDFDGFDMGMLQTLRDNLDSREFESFFGDCLGHDAIQYVPLHELSHLVYLVTNYIRHADFEYNRKRVIDLVDDDAFNIARRMSSGTHVSDLFGNPDLMGVMGRFDELTEPSDYHVTFESNRQYYDPGEYDQFMKTIADIRAMGNLIRKFTPHVPRLAEITRVGSARFSGTYEPTITGETQRVYHATTSMTHIIRNGFTGRVDGAIGLGELGRSRDEISFTTSQSIAANIARTLKEAWMIAHGKLTANDVLHMLRHDTTMDVAHMESNVGFKLADANTPKRVFKLYNYWLWMQKRRENPVFGDTERVIDYMNTIPLTEIGVVAADIRLVPDGYEYLIAEREYRVTAEYVMTGSIRKVS